MDDLRKIMYGVLIGFILLIIGWVSLLALFGCGFSFSCTAAYPKIDRTSIPTLIPATLPIPTRMLHAAAVLSTNASAPSSGTPAEGEVAIARPSNPGGPGTAINLKGDANSGMQLFATNCQTCHNNEGKGGIPNPGSTDGSVPPLNPIDTTLISADPKTYATNLDLFIEHGSTPEGNGPTFSMPAWGDKKALNPQQIADVIAYVISLNPVTTAAAAATTAPTPAGGVDIARPSNAGGPGTAIRLKGDPNSGKQVFATNCQTCHNTEGKGGIPNPGSADGTVPPLNPIDSTLISSDLKTYATNLDLFIEHGSTPEGNGPTYSMPAWGDKKALNPQQIADVISYIISLNPASQGGSGAPTNAPAPSKAATGTPAAPSTSATGTPAASSAGASPTQSEPEATEEAAHPSNPGGPGPAVDLTGDATAGQQVFTTNCQTCHNADGKGGIPNPGSSDGTVPPLNPIDPTLKDPDLKVFATNLDLFVEHGSTPEGTNPTFSMPPWGDKKALTPQQIADVISYVISLNK